MEIFYLNKQKHSFSLNKVILLIYIIYFDIYIYTFLQTVFIKVLLFIFQLFSGFLFSVWLNIMFIFILHQFGWLNIINSAKCENVCKDFK